MSSPTVPPNPNRANPSRAWLILGSAFLAFTVGGFSSPFVGSLVDRLGTRRMVLLGAALLVIGLLGSAQADALWQVVLLYGVVMTFGANCVGLLVFVPLASRLFANRRGMAISVLQ